jgi:uncharacterized membrane protein
MNFIDKYEAILNTGTNTIKIIAYTISFLLITISIIKTAFIYVYEILDPVFDDRTIFFNAKLNLGEATALALSFILGVEILRLLFIKTYKQLVFVFCLVFIKLIINWFLSREIDKISKDEYNENKKMNYFN